MTDFTPPKPQEPIAFRYRDFADGWVTTESKEEADKAFKQGAYVRALYHRDYNDKDPSPMHYAGIPVTSREYFPDPKSTETDPTGRPPNQPGAKLDSGKAPIMSGVMHYFPRALEQVALVSDYGAKKYTWNGWETVPDGVRRYGDALARHVAWEVIDGPTDPKTGLMHAAQVAWNALARLELLLREVKSHEK